MGDWTAEAGYFSFFADHPLLTFLLKRVGWMILTLWIVFTLSFFLMRQIPGGPLDRDGRNLSKDIQARIEKAYDLDKPLIVQYGIHLGRALEGDLGPLQDDRLHGQ